MVAQLRLVVSSPSLRPHTAGLSDSVRSAPQRFLLSAGTPRTFNAAGAAFYDRMFQGEAGERGVANNDRFVEIIPASDDYTFTGTAFLYTGHVSSARTSKDSLTPLSFGAWLKAVLQCPLFISIDSPHYFLLVNAAV